MGAFENQIYEEETFDSLVKMLGECIDEKHRMQARAEEWEPLMRKLLRLQKQRDDLLAALTARMERCTELSDCGVSPDYWEEGNKNICPMCWEHRDLLGRIDGDTTDP